MRNLWLYFMVGILSICAFIGWVMYVISISVIYLIDWFIARFIIKETKKPVKKKKNPTLKDCWETTLRGFF